MYIKCTHSNLLLRHTLACASIFSTVARVLAKYTSQLLCAIENAKPNVMRSHSLLAPHHTDVGTKRSDIQITLNVAVEMFYENPTVQRSYEFREFTFGCRHFDMRKDKEICSDEFQLMQLLCVVFSHSEIANRPFPKFQMIFSLFSQSFY